jgi:hypothetical protein
LTKLSEGVETKKKMKISTIAILTKLLKLTKKNRAPGFRKPSKKLETNSFVSSVGPLLELV